MHHRLRPRLVALTLALAAVAPPLGPGAALAAPAQVRVEPAVEPGAARAPRDAKRSPAVHAMGALSIKGRGRSAGTGDGPATRPSGRLAALDDAAAGAAAEGSPAASLPAGDTQAALAPEPELATTSGQPAPTTVGFDGLDDAASGVFAEPADSWLAVNAGYVGQVVNGGIRFSTRNGQALLTTSVPALFGFAASFPGIDDWGGTRLTWDAANDRWLLVVVAYDCNTTLSKGYLFGAVSRTSDPVNGGWNGFWLDYTDTRGTPSQSDDIGILPSNPVFGGSTDKVVVAADELTLANTADCLAGSAFVAASLTVIDWSSIRANPLNDFPVGYFASTSVRGWRPALPEPATTPAVHLLVETATTATTSNVGYATLTGGVTSGGASLSAVTDLTAAGVISAWTDPPLPVDPGGPIGTGVLRRGPGAVIVGAGRLAAVADGACTPAGDIAARACVRVTELDVSGGPFRVADVLFGTAGSDTFGGGIARSMGGSLHLVYAQSSASVGISAWARHRSPGDPPAAFSEPLRLAAGGSGAYDGDDWGDSLGLAQDPVDGESAWAAAPYAADGGWATWVAQVQTPGATYVPISPVRLLDTRFGNGLTGTFVHDQPRTWQVTGRGGIPGDAVAVTGNVTVTEQTGSGWLTVAPTPTTDASPSTINFPIGDNRANNVTMLLGPGGTLSAVLKTAAGRTTHLIFDVTGYFVASPAGATYRTLAPSRSLDTRFGNGLSGPFSNAVPRTWHVAGRNGVPTSAVAVTGNVTVTQQQGPGYLAVTPTPVANPTTSTINFPAGDDRANGITVPLGPDGTLSAVFRGGAGKTTHLVVDVTGYYVNDLGGARFVPLVPGRVLDSRFGTGLVGKFVSYAARQLAVVPNQGVPPNATAFTGNLTVVNQTWPGYVSLTQYPTGQPETSTLNFPAKDIRANGVTSPLGTSGTAGLIYIGGSGTTDLIVDVTGYFR